MHPFENEFRYKTMFKKSLIVYIKEKCFFSSNCLDKKDNAKIRIAFYRRLFLIVSNLHGKNNSLYLSLFVNEKFVEVFFSIHTKPN